MTFGFEILYPSKLLRQDSLAIGDLDNGGEELPVARSLPRKHGKLIGKSRWAN